MHIGSFIIGCAVTYLLMTSPEVAHWLGGLFVNAGTYLESLSK
jgi:hypothetical protein